MIMLVIILMLGSIGIGIFIGALLQREDYRREASQYTIDDYVNLIDESRL